MSPEDAAKNAGANADYHTADLFNAIGKGDYPVWTLYVQVMDPKVAETYSVNIFDITKTWPRKDFPLLPVGKMTLNRNVSELSCLNLPRIKLTEYLSRTITSKTLNRLPSRRPIWFPESLSLPTLVSIIP